MDWPAGTETYYSDVAPHELLVKLKDRKGGDMDAWPKSVRVRDYPVNDE
jgi:hypothetical protein